MTAPLSFVWTWPGVDVTRIDPTSVTVARDPAGRWFVTFHVDVADPAPLPATGESVGVDVGLKHFAVLSTGEKIPHPRDWERHLLGPQATQREPVAVHQPAAAAGPRLGDDRNARGAERAQVPVDRPDADPEFGGERPRGRPAPGLEQQDHPEQAVGTHERKTRPYR